MPVISFRLSFNKIKQKTNKGEAPVNKQQQMVYKQQVKPAAKPVALNL